MRSKIQSDCKRSGDKYKNLYYRIDSYQVSQLSCRIPPVSAIALILRCCKLAT
jgi:hypothetical protein